MNDPASSLSITLPDEATTRQLGEDLVLALKPGDCIALQGDLGAGKSTLARALIRALAEDAELEVPSPTFTLVQVYDLRLPVAHFDLYRLGDSSELDELGFDEALEEGVCLVEWPSQAEDRLPKQTLWLNYAFTPDGGRELTLTGPTEKLSRIRRILSIRQFLNENGMAGAERRFLSGDADYRAYEYVHLEDQPRRILMDSPKRPATPVIRDGKTYPELVHLAEDCRAFIAVDHLLKDMGVLVPDIFAADTEQGLLLIEDLGADGVLNDEGKPIAERYLATTEVLAYLHGQNVSREIPVAPDHIHRIPDFDAAAMGFETELLLDWYLPWKLDRQATETERQEYQAIWTGIISRIHDHQSLVLRDVHSPNLLWQPDRHGLHRIGLIDFQDAMIGPAAYDLASLVQDARVTIEPGLQQQMLDHYLALRDSEAGFDRTALLQDFAIMAAQRNCKLLGLWVRLLKRDGKPGYIQHMPRTQTYLASVLRHEVMAPLKIWLDKLGLSVES
ncbi:tRNA (adenosine(37)-N6)-threonylcarbamoyltransferase complex ATPase subunit type 1 TsaE [Rhizobium paknamense]|uniref:tRNA threonylcarbamoyladenosine biosynthesis protein TsaE n=1 Tax=Rhizobium paknamense TaxID=1206817 RepID=A0ABU0IJW8_9HYPH|nr:tRNA (adenosine(37)-N6)-threonylcarbamoyltransferase complex ATPase subunit type 1 TsaE [Rhizobium paknamense]MDQ0457972.1 tRNA threonylcarbamoyl adenosine modification protein YjeE [Rhizobium paknamense]